MPAALILIDIQQGLDDPWYGVRNNPHAEQHAARLLQHWRSQQWPVVHIQHLSTNPESPLYPGKPGVPHKREVAPAEGEPVMTKNVNSGFIGTDLEQWLRENGIGQVVIAGLTTNHCVETTTRMAGNLGFDATLAHDACAAHDLTGPDGTHYSADTVHAMSLANIASEFAAVLSTDQVIERLS
jgi:nicotinamidase-related amidase